jgi:hypothetical protein
MSRKCLRDGLVLERVAERLTRGQLTTLAWLV